MKYKGPTRFKITHDARQYDVVREKGPRFAGLAASKQPKVYVFSRNNKPIYVGATVRKMVDRMRLGWTAAGKSGFYGYRFRHEGSTVDLDVWEDEDPVSERQAGMRSGSDAETLEAEVVYLLRLLTGQWPAFQTEIHFYPSTDEHRRMAREIVAHYGLKPPPGLPNP